MKSSRNLVVFLAGALLSFSVCAAGSDYPLKKFDLVRSDQNLQEGFKTVRNLCLPCHDLKYIKYRNLEDIGFTKDEIDRIRGSYGLGDTLRATMSGEVATRIFGIVPPDLSLMAKARKGGPHYIYTLLTSYYEKSDAQYDNHLFPGIRMPDIFDYATAAEAKGQEAIEQRVQHLAEFLEWAADPKRSDRIALGGYVVGYFIILTLLLYLLKRRVWSRLD